MSWILLIPQAVVFLLRTEVITRTMSVYLFPFFEIVFNLLLSFCLSRYAYVVLTGCDVLIPELAVSGGSHGCRTCCCLVIAWFSTVSRHGNIFLDPNENPTV